MTGKGEHNIFETGENLEIVKYIFNSFFSRERIYFNGCTKRKVLTKVSCVLSLAQTSCKCEIEHTNSELVCARIIVHTL